MTIKEIQATWNKKEALLKQGNKYQAMMLRRRIRRIGHWQKGIKHYKPVKRRLEK